MSLLKVKLIVMINAQSYFKVYRICFLPDYKHSENPYSFYLYVICTNIVNLFRI